MVESFKTYTHSVRAQFPEELYNRGMQYTNAPLAEGFCNLLVNYDLKDGGAYMAPRPGLVPTKLISFPVPPVVLHTDAMFLSDARECIEEDGVTYQQFILGDKDDNKLYVITNPPGDVPAAKINTLTSSGRFGQRHIGTFAFNNNYYFFDDTGLNRTAFDDPTKAYEAEAVAPRSLRPSEAVMWGYNMLQANPYMFTNTMHAVDSPVYLDGVLPYDESDNLAMSPQVNQALHFECFYRAFPGKTYEVKWEWKEAGVNTWTELKKENIVIAADKKFKCNFNVPNTSIMLRVTATNTSVATDMQVVTIGFDFSKASQGSAANSKQTVYNLKDASNMAFWKNRLAVSVKNLLFLSEVNNPEYFPYPNNMEPFFEEIIHLVAHLDNLLVFTTTKLYSLTLSADGLSWNVKCIQGNLDIKQSELHLIQPVKNMVFFKSGKYYYMVVPKASSTTGELTIAPVSRPVEPLLDHLQDVIDKLLQTLYDYTDGTTILEHYNFLDFEDIHNIYALQTTKGVLVNVDLLYNTVLRVWRIYVFESSHIVTSFRQDATTRGTFMELTPVDTAPCIRLLKFDSTDCKDSEATFFKNYQMLDTGYRDIVSNLKKRFREAQLKLNNLSGKTLDFYTEFYIDGETRRTFYRYEPHHETNPESPDYGLLTMERELVDPSILPGVTLLSGEEDLNCWTLDVSLFPDTPLWKIRIPFSGKGYCPRMVLISYNEEPYELLNNVWVFRQLNSR